MWSDRVHAESKMPFKLRAEEVGVMMALDGMRRLGWEILESWPGSGKTNEEKRGFGLIKWQKMGRNPTDWLWLADVKFWLRIQEKLIVISIRPHLHSFKMAAYRPDTNSLLSYVRVSNTSKMAACNRKWNNVYLSMIAKKFQRLYLSLASSIINGLNRILFHVRVYGKFVVYIHFRLQASICDFSLTPTKGQCLDQFSRFAGHRKDRYSRWNFVSIMCKSWEIRYFLSISGSRPPSLSSNSTWRRTFVPQYSHYMFDAKDMRKNSVEISHIPSAMSGLSVSGFTFAILISGWTRIE